MTVLSAEIMPFQIAAPTVPQFCLNTKAISIHSFNSLNSGILTSFFFSLSLSLSLKICPFKRQWLYVSTTSTQTIRPFLTQRYRWRHGSEATVTVGNGLLATN
jgi:hypothetical protein